MSIGKRLRETIEAQGISQYDLAKTTGLPQSTISRIVNDGTEKPNKKTIELIADALRINAEWLRTGEGDILAYKADITVSPEFMVSTLLTQLEEKDKVIAHLIGQVNTLSDQLREMEVRKNSIKKQRDKYIEELESKKDKDGTPDHDNIRGKEYYK